MSNAAQTLTFKRPVCWC